MGAFQQDNLAVRLHFEPWRIFAEQLAPPPRVPVSRFVFKSVNQY